MPQGRVKRYERNSGFGFIEREGEDDLFVHHSALKDREFLLAGQRVEFSVEQSDRGPRAVGVRVIEEVSPKRKHHPDWRGHRGGTPHFASQERGDAPAEEERVIPGKGRARPARAGGERLGPPRMEDAEEGEELEQETSDS
jgi:cold shock protein